MTGIFNNIETNLSDLLFQFETPLNGNIALIEIDSKSLTELGPFNTWPRDYMARVISSLNSDSKVTPAVIGIDIMYFGNTTKEADKALVDACSIKDNVVIGSLVDYSSTLKEDEDGNFYMDNDYISQFEEPFYELKNVTRQGHLNTITDSDGIVRKSLNYINVPDGRRINSFAYEVYKLYSEKMGIKLNDMLSHKCYITYSVKPGGYSDGYSFTDILNDRINPDVFKDKIVLIGPYSVGLMDDYITSIEHSRPMYGIEVHANIIDTLINGKLKTDVPKTIEYILVFVIVFFSISIFSKKSIKASILFLVILTVGYWGLACGIYHIFDKMLDVLYIPLFVIITYIVILAIRYINVLIEKRKIEGTFKRYVAPQVVNKIMKDGMDKIELAGKRVDIACLFVDIRGFTPMSEGLQPEEVVEILNEYLNLTSSSIFKNDGTLDKFIGDATMAIFNAPLELDDYVYKAVKTAVDIASGSEVLEKKLKERFGKTVSFGIGVNCGPAVVGNIGMERRLDYTAIGDTVNTAARLESNAKAGQILISRAVYDRLEGRIIATSIGEIPLKGKSNGVEVFIVEKLL